MSINDKKISDLKTLGYTGGFNDMELTWLTALGYTTGSLQDRWIAYLEGEGYTGSLNDMLMAWLAAKGYSGSLTDRVIAALEADDFYVVTTLIFSAFSSTSSVLSLDASTASGSAAATFARSSTGYCFDLDGIYRNIDSGQERWQGGRYVKNLLTYSTDMTNAAWTKSNFSDAGTTTTAPDGSTVKWYDFGDGYSFQIVSAISVGDTAATSMWIKANKSATIGFRNVDGTNASINLTTAWQRFGDHGTVSTNGDRSLLDNRASSGFGVADLQVAVYCAQYENASGQSATSPGECVETTTAAVAKWYDTTNGNTVASNVVTEATGSALRPTNQPDDGSSDTRYAVYSQWQASTAYSVGDRIIPTDVSEFFCRGLNDVYLECTTAGTSAGSEPTWDRTLTNTTNDNTAVWTCNGYYTLKGVLIEGAETNELLQSRQFDTTWTQDGTPTLSQNQTGIDGVANTAWTLGDDDGAGYEQIVQSVTVANDSNTHCASIFIKKDSDTTRFPEFQLLLINGTGQNIGAQLNTQTGATTTRYSAGTTSASVEDHGDWWRLILTVANNSTGNTAAQVKIAPAVTTTWGAAEAAATGTIIADQAQLELNTSVASSPIPTTTSTVTRALDQLSYVASGNLEDDNGALLADATINDWANTTNDTRILGTQAGTRLWSVQPTSNSGMYCVDGTNSAYGPAGAPDGIQRSALRWNSSTPAFQAVVEGTAGTAVSYDGGLNTTTIWIGSRAASVNIIEQMLLLNFRIYSDDKGQTWLEGETAND